MGEIKRDAEKTKSRLQETGEDLLAYIQFTEFEFGKIRQSGEQNPQERIYPDQITPTTPGLPSILKNSTKIKKYLTRQDEGFIIA